ncbi:MULTISPECIES: Rha family transcriptional regulator [unclassified Mannheimia]|uniref:Rha family transcriptional regulator n=1 Tax=unclassified Mannheimia TaxID=2645054 RepID=UPI00359DD380
MNQLLNIPEQKSSITISSIEIAQLCEKRHDHVMVDIRKMLAELNLNSPEFSGQYKTKDGRIQPCFFLPKREAMILVSGYRIDLRAKIIDRLEELEKQHQPSIPKNYPEALRVAAELAEQNQVLLLEKQQTTAENNALKSYFEPGLTPAQFVKGLNGVNSNKINDYLRSRGWLYKEKHCWRVCSQFRDKYLTESFKRIEVDPVERIEMTTYKPILLEKGAVKIFEAYLQGKLPMKADWNGKYYHSKVAV